MRKRQTVLGRQNHNYLTFWQRLILISAVLLSGETLAIINSSQAVHAQIVCHAGNGGNGGNAVGGVAGADGGIGGDCVIGGHKTFSPGGPLQNNGNNGNNQANGIGAS